MPARASLVARLSLLLSSALLVAAAFTPASVVGGATSPHSRKLAPLARERALRGTGWSRVIVQAADRKAARAAILAVGGKPGRSLPGISSLAAIVPDTALSE